MRRMHRAAAVSGLIAALVLAGGTAAHADDPQPGSTASPSTSSSTAASPAPSATVTTGPSQAEIRAIAQKVADLQAAADRRGEAAQKAGEKANDAMAAARTAEFAAQDARTAADAAAAAARTSRARAATVAARLARADYGTLPLDLMLNGKTAGGVLGGLSTAGQLSGQAKTLYLQAEADSARAEMLRTQEETKAAAAVKAAADAAQKYKDAKKASASAEKDVSAALAEQQQLLSTVSSRSVTALADTCAALGSTDVAGCSIPGDDSASASGGIGDRVVAFARAQIGEPYVFAAAGPSSWDCSGLTLGAWASVGVSIGIHSATAQYRLARDKGELVPAKDAQPGDLLFYTDGGGDMYHITIYSGQGRMIEAPYPGSTVREVPVRQGDLLGSAAHIR